MSACEDPQEAVDLAASPPEGGDSTASNQQAEDELRDTAEDLEEEAAVLSSACAAVDESTPYVAGATVPQAPASGPVPHSWSRLDAGAFLVRHGPNYKKKGLKLASESALYEVLAFDIFSSAKHKVDCIGDRVVLPTPPHPSPNPLVPNLLIVNVQLPLESPAVFSPALDGPTMHCVFYLGLSEAAARALAVGGGHGDGGGDGASEELSPALRLLCEYCAAAEADTDMRGRFKAIGFVNNVHEAGIPNVVAQYNGKPVLVTKSGTLSRVGASRAHLEMDCNVRHWCYLARKGVHHLMPRFTRMSLRVAFVLEGRGDSELPERVLACAHVSNVDPRRARPI